MLSEKTTHAGLQRILRHAMNYGCGSAIVTWIQASKHKNITIFKYMDLYQHNNITIPSVILKELVVCGGCNEMTAAATPSCGQKRHIRWPATNASACNELLARNEFQMLMCHHAVRKDTHAGLQRMLRQAMTYGCGTQPVLTREFCQIQKRISMRTCSSMDFETTIRLHKLSINLSIYRPIYLSMYLSISPCIDLCIYRCIYLSLSLSIYLSISVMQRGVV